MLSPPKIKLKKQDLEDEESQVTLVKAVWYEGIVTVTANSVKIADFGVTLADEHMSIEHMAKIFKYLGIKQLTEVSGLPVSLDTLNQAIDRTEGFKFVEPEKSNKKFRNKT